MRPLSVDKAVKIQNNVILAKNNPEAQLLFREIDVIMNP
jgi:hypothetical protein